MKRYFDRDSLIQKIQQFAALARDHRQISKRLEQLLPDRLTDVARAQRQRGASPSEAMRKALVSEEYISCINEVVEVSNQSIESRIQYETHLMLFEAKKSLRKS